MKTISLALQKGGVGKTSISVSLAYELSKTSRTLLIDADPQGNSTSWLLGNYSGKELADYFVYNEPIENCLTKTPYNNLDLLPTKGIGGHLKDYRNTLSKPFEMADLVDKLKEMNKYDYCIIDTSPSTSMLETSVYFASDNIVPVLQLSLFSIAGLQIFFNNLNEECKAHRIQTRPQTNSIIVNGYDARIAFQKESVESFSKENNYNVFLVPVDQTFNKSQVMNKPIQEMAGAKKATLEELVNLANYCKEGKI